MVLDFLGVRDESRVLTFLLLAFLLVGGQERPLARGAWVVVFVVLFGLVVAEMGRGRRGGCRRWYENGG